jgi:hypothetical protein
LPVILNHKPKKPLPQGPMAPANMTRKGAPWDANMALSAPHVVLCVECMHANKHKPIIIVGFRRKELLMLL